MIRFLAVVLGGLIAVTLGFVVVARRRQPEPTWEPGLEFNPDFDLTAEEILADIRGEAPTA